MLFILSLLTVIACALRKPPLLPFVPFEFAVCFVCVPISCGKLDLYFQILISALLAPFLIFQSSKVCAHCETFLILRLIVCLFCALVEFAKWHDSHMHIRYHCRVILVLLRQVMCSIDYCKAFTNYYFC